MWYRGFLFALPCREKAILRSHGVAVSSPPSHGGRTGSNPVGTIFLDSSEVIEDQCARPLADSGSLGSSRRRLFIHPSRGSRKLIVREDSNPTPPQAPTE